MNLYDSFKYHRINLNYVYFITIHFVIRFFKTEKLLFTINNY